jgi:hypothetical protein
MPPMLDPDDDGLQVHVYKQLAIYKLSLYKGREKGKVPSFYISKPT